MAQNKIETLSPDSKMPKDRLCPVLEEIYLQDNRLEQLPEFIMTLPALEIIDVSNNKLQCLPDNLWQAPKLKELNASFNLLKDLPSKVSQNVKTSQQRENSLSSSNIVSNRRKIGGGDTLDYDLHFSKFTNARVVEMERPYVWTKSVQVNLVTQLIF